MRHLLPVLLLILLLSPLSSLRSSGLGLSDIAPRTICASCCEDCYAYGWSAYDLAYANYLEIAIAMHGGYPGPNDPCWDEIHNQALADAQGAYTGCLGDFCWPHEICYPYID